MNVSRLRVVAICLAATLGLLLVWWMVSYIGTKDSPLRLFDTRSLEDVSVQSLYEQNSSAQLATLQVIRLQAADADLRFVRQLLEWTCSETYDPFAHGEQMRWIVLLLNDVVRAELANETAIEAIANCGNAKVLREMIIESLRQDRQLDSSRSTNASESNEVGYARADLGASAFESIKRRADAIEFGLFVGVKDFDLTAKVRAQLRSEHSCVDVATGKPIIWLPLSDAVSLDEASWRAPLDIRASVATCNGQRVALATPLEAADDDGDQAWRVVACSRSVDEIGRLALVIKLDEAGTRRLWGC